MEKKEAAHALAELIREKEVHHEAEGKALKAHFSLTYESLKPINILKSTLRDAASAPDLKIKILETAVGMASGMAAKRLLVGATRNPITKLLGGLLEMGVSGLVAKNSRTIRSAARLMFGKMSRRSGSDAAE